MLAHRPWRWPNINPTLDQHLVLDGFTGRYEIVHQQGGTNLASYMIHREPKVLIALMTVFSPKFCRSDEKI